jgi:hypothetical protein
MQTYSKLELGLMQLDRALKLYLNERDYVSAITLAAAAEDVLGCVYANQVKRDPETRDTAHRHEMDLVLEVSKQMFGEKLSPSKDVSPMLNRARDELKHWGMGLPVEMNFEAEARYMIERAVYNLRLCTGNCPDQIGEFDASKPPRSD